MDHHFSPSLHQSQAPFSHLSVHGGIAYTAGIIGQDRTTGALHPGGVSEQCALMLENLGVLLTENGLDRSRIIRTTVYLTSYDDFDVVNTEYARRFRAPYPARTTLQVAGLPLGASVQIDAVVATDTAS
ncbi:RidA family protein [Corynebacterium sp.]|jgi:2-iminobutanoate/2-iminopropanoate deaminase|uniref:RidA family protein n=1 Tax=Corynebacterium sp. TaxID=1720 RepID=UPI0025C33E73|nr:RidA family protein [Corynebacterium sp.]